LQEFCENYERDVLDSYEQFIVDCTLSKRPTLA
jgi:hypothetical protein